MIFPVAIKVNEELVDKTANFLIETLKLKVVSESKHEFTNDGLTKLFVLSQSHLVIHSWPEYQALHIDLMTCSPENELKNKEVLSSLGAEEVEMIKFEY